VQGSEDDDDDQQEGYMTMMMLDGRWMGDGQWSMVNGQWTPTCERSRNTASETFESHNTIKEYIG
jgi:hypothetical protein